MRSEANEKRPLGKTLLIVEDDQDIREALDGLLRMEGYDVMGCANGLEALQQLRRGPQPDVILLDLMMPVMDGWQFRIEQKRDPSLASIPVVALSADATPKAAAIDAEAYLKKPVDYETLVETIERMVLNREHKELQSKLAQTDRLTSLGTLAAGVAHEINNPLAYVLLNISFVAEQLPQLLDDAKSARFVPSAPSALSALADGDVSTGGIDDEPSLEAREAQVRVALEHAKDGAERIRSIVRGLKTFSRPEDESRAPVDVRKVMESSLGMVHNEIRHRARLVKNFGDVPPVFANDARLGQVFLNLLVNAAQSLPEGNAARNEIRVSTRLDSAGMVQIEVRDTGAGIPANIRGRIFEPFFTTKPVGIGTGLGLAICHGIVTSFGGRLSVDSEVGRGSAFRVELPVAPAAAGAPESSRPSLKRAHDMPRGKVLVIDDEPIICFTIERLLSVDYEVLALTSAAVALDRIRAGERFDVILCDLMMPDMDGIELYQEVGRASTEQAERIVFVTGGAFTPRGQEFLSSVPNARVEKPFEVEALLQLIRERMPTERARQSAIA
jgi:signal transduction histidine kinase